MIALILAGAAFLTAAMGFIGIPRALAEWISGFNMPPWALLIVLTLFYIVLGCFLDGISMVVLTIGVIMPPVRRPASTCSGSASSSCSSSRWRRSRRRSASTSSCCRA